MSRRADHSSQRTVTEGNWEEDPGPELQRDVDSDSTFDSDTESETVKLEPEDEMTGGETHS